MSFLESKKKEIFNNTLEKAGVSFFFFSFFCFFFFFFVFFITYLFLLLFHTTPQLSKTQKQTQTPPDTKAHSHHNQASTH